MTRPRLMVTAGPTREHLDDIRYITSASTGRMGIEVARAAANRGWTVHLLLGPTVLEPPTGVEVHRFVSAHDLDERASGLWPEVDALVATAAVCDFHPAERIPGKRKKGDSKGWDLRLLASPDVLGNRSREKGSRVIVGFALETALDPVEARRKLVQKHLDLIILNTAANLASAGGDFHWIEARGTTRSFLSTTKAELSDSIVSFIEQRLSC